MNLIEKYKNWKDAPNPAPLSVKRICLVIQAYFRKIFSTKGIIVPLHITEQYEYRMSIIPDECKKANYCTLNCGCALDKLWDDEGCICYPPMMSKKEWKEFKETL